MEEEEELHSLEAFEGGPNALFTFCEELVHLNRLAKRIYYFEALNISGNGVVVY